MDADGSDVHEVTNVAGSFEGLPVWSPSGERLAYVNEPSEVWTIGSDGSDPTFVIGDHAWEPAWQPVVAD
jgi:Tol biopolymer transport system component